MSAKRKFPAVHVLNHYEVPETMCQQRTLKLSTIIVPRKLLDLLELLQIGGSIWQEYCSVAF